MPSARKRGTRSPTPPAPAPRAPQGTERNRALRLLLIAFAVGGGLWWYFRQPPIADLHPIANQNVLLITIDTLRADALGAYGGPARTPALDRFAADGVRFDFAHAHAVVTLPSHASILTGLYPFQHGVRDNAGYRLAPKTQTLATRLKQKGYATAAFVGAFPVHSRFGLNIGFDVYDDRFGETRAPTEFVMPERPASAVVPLARDWIRARSNPPSAIRNPQSQSPWLVWVHLFDPHAPYRPPAPYDTEYAERPYYGEVAATDAALAPLLDDVRASARPTLVIVTGDHGESLGEHGEATHGLFAYESTLRIPLIIGELGGQAPRKRGVEGPDMTGSPGEVSHAAARHIDILPTIFEAIDAPIPSDLPGRSLIPAAARRSTAPVTSYFEAMAGMLTRGSAPLRGVLADREKYIELPIAERYDLTADAAETQNLFGRARDRDRTLAAALRAFHAPLPGERQTETRETAVQLQALGYVSGRAPLKTTYTEADDPKRLVDVDAAVHAAVEAFSSGHADEAVRLYQQVLARRPDMAIAYRHLAFVEWERGNPTAALAVLERARAARVENDGIVTQFAGYLAESGQPANAIALLEPLATGGVVDPDTLNALGIAYARAGRSAEATRTFERVLKVNPESSIPLENLGILALERGRFDEARGYFERAVNADPRSSRAHADLGVVALKAGDHQTAIAEWRQAMQLDPTNYDALYNLATTLARDRRDREAQPLLEQFLRTAPAAFYANDLETVRRLQAALR